jgi:hypothetical protein
MYANYFKKVINIPMSIVQGALKKYKAKKSH